MNIDKPEISRKLGKLMTTMNIPPSYQEEFLREAFKAKDMESFIEDINAESFLNEVQKEHR